MLQSEKNTPQYWGKKAPKNEPLKKPKYARNALVIVSEYNRKDAI